MLTEESEFKGHKILTIKNEQGRRFFSAGVNKCKIILEHLEAIKAFVVQNTSPDTVNRPSEPLREANIDAEV